jgi:hypothetical protein
MPAREHIVALRNVDQGRVRIAGNGRVTKRNIRAAKPDALRSGS